MAPRGRSAFAFGMLFAGLAAFLLAAGVPRLLAALAMLPGDPALAEIEDGKPVDAADLVLVVAGRQEARRYVADPRLNTDIALAQLLLVDQQAPGAAERRALVDQAVDQLRHGIALAPANGFAWARLAHALSLQGGRDAAALAAWRLSIATAPAEPKLVAWRAQFANRRQAMLDAADIRLLTQQLQLALRFRKQGVNWH
jgi:hypothetical protein